MFEKKLLLDTCALLWLVGGNKELSDKAREAIDRAVIVYVSVISAWEIGLQYERKELILPMDAEIWFMKAVEKHFLNIAALDVPVVCRANKLPPLHKDPADRFIISTAIGLNASIVTADSHFDKYGVKIIR